MHYKTKEFIDWIRLRFASSKAIKNVGWLFVEKIIRMTLGFLVSTWVARYLGAEKFGLLNFAIAFVSIFSAIAILGLQGVVVKQLVNHPESKGEILGTSGALIFISGFLAYFLCCFTIFLLNRDATDIVILVAIVGAGLVCKFSEVGLYWFESQIESKYIAWVQAFSFMVFSGVKIFLILRSENLVAFAWAYMLESFVTGIMVISVFRLKTKHFNYLTIKTERAKNLIKESLPLMFASLSVILYLRVDEIMLGQMIGYKAVGIYSAAVRISEAMYFIPVIISISYFPIILSTKKQNDENLLCRKFQRLFDLMMIISITLSVIISLLASKIILTAYGDSFEEAIGVLRIHVWASVFVFLGTASAKWLITEGYQKIAFKRTFLGLLINIILNLIFIPSYGIKGAAWATLISYGVVGFISDLFQNETNLMFKLKTRSFNLLGIYERNFK